MRGNQGSPSASWFWLPNEQRGISSLDRVSCGAEWSGCGVEIAAATFQSALTREFTQYSRDSTNVGRTEAHGATPTPNSQTSTVKQPQPPPQQPQSAKQPQRQPPTATTSQQPNSQQPTANSQPPTEPYRQPPTAKPPTANSQQPTSATCQTANRQPPTANPNRKNRQTAKPPTPTQNRKPPKNRAQSVFTHERTSTCYGTERTLFVSGKIHAQDSDRP